MAMKRLIFWVLSLGAWAIAAGLAYIGFIFLLFGPMMGPRGDIDFVDFSTREKHAANVQAFWTSVFGLVPLAMAAFILWYHRRVIRWLLGRK